MWVWCARVFRLFAHIGVDVRGLCTLVLRVDETGLGLSCLFFWPVPNSSRNALRGIGPTVLSINRSRPGVPLGVSADHALRPRKSAWTCSAASSAAVWQGQDRVNARGFLVEGRKHRSRQHRPRQQPQSLSGRTDFASAFSWECHVATLSDDDTARCNCNPVLRGSVCAFFR